MTYFCYVIGEICHKICEKGVFEKNIFSKTFPNELIFMSLPHFRTEKAEFAVHFAIWADLWALFGDRSLKIKIFIMGRIFAFLKPIGTIDHSFPCEISWRTRSSCPVWQQTHSIAVMHPTNMAKISHFLVCDISCNNRSEMLFLTKRVTDSHSSWNFT